jgi:hypothetical protein
MISRYTLLGRRRKNRRTRDAEADYYADKIGRNYWFFVAVILFLSMIDAKFTLYYLRSGNFSELNPIMRFLVEKSSNQFLIVKYLLTALGLILLVIHQHFRFMRPIVVFIFIAYLGLCLYHLYFLLRFMAY